MDTKKLTLSVTLLAGFQWLFFMFANTIVIPISIGSAFQLEQIEIVSAIQRSFILTGVACFLQGPHWTSFGFNGRPIGSLVGRYFKLGCNSKYNESGTIDNRWKHSGWDNDFWGARHGFRIVWNGGAFKEMVYTSCHVCLSSITR